MFRTLPQFGADPRNVAEIVRQIMNGKTNNTGTVTLATGNATTTTLFDERISPDTKIVLMPFSAAGFSDVAPYGEFACTTGQTAAAANTAYAMGMNTTVLANGITLVSTTDITVKNPGLYQLIFSMQFENRDNADHSVSVWFKKNNVDIAFSNRIFTIPERKSATIFGNVAGQATLKVELAANDYITAYWSTPSTDVILQATGTQTSPTRPATPCKVANIQFVAPQAYSNIYVSAQTQGSATITHFSNDTADKTYGYILVG